MEISRIENDLGNEVSVLRKLYKLGLIKSDHENEIYMCFKHRLSQYNLDDNYIISLFKLKSLNWILKLYVKFLRLQINWYLI